MSPALRARVRERAGNRCEYCQLRQEDSPLAVLHIEHIVPRIHGAGDDLDNLALACIDCNLHKGPNLQDELKVCASGGCGSSSGTVAGSGGAANNSVDVTIGFG